MSPTRPLWTPLVWFSLTTLIGGGCDLQTKIWAENALLGQPRRSSVIIEPWLELSLAYNRGTAFSLISDLRDARLLFGILALVVVGALLITIIRSCPSRYESLALGTIAGGALGNGIDRLIRLTPHGEIGVIDFIKINYPWGGSWPTFNVADVLIAVGVGALLLGSFWGNAPTVSKPATSSCA